MDLSKEQDRVNNLPLGESHLVLGPPGTGKTVVALYRASMLQKRKTPVTLVAYNKLLGTYLSGAVGQLAINSATKTYHSWFWGLYRRHFKADLPTLGSSWDPDWNRILQDFSSHPLPDSLREYLIIDEGQDLHPMFYALLPSISSNFTIFADENQRITSEHSTISNMLACLPQGYEPYWLHRNYRNTREIAQVAAAYYTGADTGIPDLPERKGSTPQVRCFGTLDEQAEFIARYEKNNPSKQVGVFVYTKKQLNKLKYRLEGRTHNRLQFYMSNSREASFDPSKKGITLLCYASSKGLEFDTVFLPALEGLPLEAAGDPSWTMKMYVMCARARDELFFLHSADEEPGLLTKLTTGLVTRR